MYCPVAACITNVSQDYLNRLATVRQGAFLPHWTLDGAIYHTVFRLADSLPANVVDEFGGNVPRSWPRPANLLRPPLDNVYQSSSASAWNHTLMQVGANAGSVDRESLN